MAPPFPEFTRPRELLSFLLATIFLCSSLVQPTLCALAEGNSYYSERRSLTASGGSEVATHGTNLARAIAATPNNYSLAGYTYSGCYADADPSSFVLLGTNSQYLLNGRSYTSAFGMTWAACASYCTGYQYFGIAAGSTCRCGNSFAFSSNLSLDILCQTPCTGNSLQSCGASNRSTIFRNSNYGGTSPISPAVSVVPSVPVLPSSSSPAQVLPLVALVASPTTRASTLSILASTIPSSTVAQTASASQAVLVAPAPTSFGAALAPIPTSPAVPVLAATMIGAPLSVTAVSSISPDVPLPASTLIGPALNWVGPGSSATASGQPSISTMIGPALAFAAPVPLEPSSGQTSKIQPLVPSVVPVLSLLAPTSVASISPVQQAEVPTKVVLAQLPFSSILVPLFQSSSTAAGVVPVIRPLPVSSTSAQATPTSQPLFSPLVPPATLLPALVLPTTTSVQAPSLLAPTLPPASSSLVPLVALPNLLFPSLATTLATVVSSPVLGVLALGVPPAQILNLQSPFPTLNAAPSTTTPTVAPFPSIDLSPVIPVAPFNTLLPASPGTNSGALAALPVVTPIDEPFRIFGLWGEATAAGPLDTLPPAAILPSVRPAPVVPSQPSIPLPPVQLGILPTTASLLPSLATTTLNVPPLESPPLAAPTGTGTPWWVVTEFLEPHGLPGPTILAPPPPAIQPPAPPLDEPMGTFGALLFNSPAEIEAPSNPGAIPSESPQPAIIDSGVVVDKVFTWTFYSTGLVQVDDRFLSPFAGPLQGVLADGTRIGLDGAGLFIGTEHRVPYPAEYSSVVAGRWLPPPQLVL